MDPHLPRPKTLAPQVHHRRSSTSGRPSSRRKRATGAVATPGWTRADTTGPSSARLATSRSRSRAAPAMDAAAMGLTACTAEDDGPTICKSFTSGVGLEASRRRGDRIHLREAPRTTLNSFNKSSLTTKRKVHSLVLVIIMLGRGNESERREGEEIRLGPLREKFRDESRNNYG
jgi:hypothetical protein